jgi:hypothetical protein
VRNEAWDFSFLLAYVIVVLMIYFYIELALFFLEFVFGGS